ncbi:unnamed protein product [Angiostrongylus costaricensis]|uniref:Protein kinase domain-containing protein n=1 Tax=Angiostrongylus costaricensis TaxID=334426 RepID=A0A158PL85_ANGCS|nr:unnamed protein product [Angiostrongylus costaricensis]
MAHEVLAVIELPVAQTIPRHAWQLQFEAAIFVLYGEGNAIGPISRISAYSARVDPPSSPVIAVLRRSHTNWTLMDREMVHRLTTAMAPTLSMFVIIGLLVRLLDRNFNLFLNLVAVLSCAQKMLYNNDFGLPELRDAKNHRKFYAMKVEKQLNCERPVLKLDVAVLSQLRTAAGFPTLIVAGRTNAFKFCVMQLLGPDLRSLMLVMPSKKFSPATAYKIAIQTLDRLETLHDIGYLNRDVKSQNFAIGLENQSSIVYMLDFGLTRRFRNEDGTLMKRRIYGPCVGTFPFAPLASATMRDQAPKDDLEGWFYMIMEIFIGFLPWYHEKMILDHSLTREWKQYARGAFKSTMLRSLPCEFTPIFNNIITMRFEERPRYYFIRRMVSASAIRQGVNLNAPYDWQVVPALLSLVKQTTEYDSPPTASVTNKLEDDRELATANFCQSSNSMVSVATGVS